MNGKYFVVEGGGVKAFSTRLNGVEKQGGSYIALTIKFNSCLKLQVTRDTLSVRLNNNNEFNTYLLAVQV